MEYGLYSHVHQGGKDSRYGLASETVSDFTILSTHDDGVLMVLDAQNTRKGALREGMRSLEAVGANVLGTVMNNIKWSKGGYYYGQRV